MGNFDNAAPGEAGATMAAPVALPQEILTELFSLSVHHDKQQADRNAVGLLGQVADLLAESGVDPLLVAEALAGGRKAAAGRLFQLRARAWFDADCEFTGGFGAMEDLLLALDPAVRAEAVRALAHHLTESERALLGWSDGALPTSIPNVELWFDDLNYAERRKLTEFVLAKAGFDDAARAAIARVLLKLGADVARGASSPLVAPVPAGDDELEAVRLFGDAHAVVEANHPIVLFGEDAITAIHRIITVA